MEDGQELIIIRCSVNDGNIMIDLLTTINTAVVAVFSLHDADVMLTGRQLVT